MNDANGVVVLDTATAILFNMEKKGTGIRVITAAAAKKTPPGSDGVVEYTWLAGDTDDWGLFRGLFVVTFPEGEATFPSDGYVEISIQRDISKFPG